MQGLNRVLYNVDQRNDTTAAEKATARANIGAQGALTAGSNITISTQPAFNYNKPNGTATRYNARSGQGSRTAYKGTSSVNATLSTQVGVTAHAAAACTMSGAISDAAAMSTETTGSGDAHNNMQPYVTMNYIISVGD